MNNLERAEQILDNAIEVAGYRTALSALCLADGAGQYGQAIQLLTDRALKVAGVSAEYHELTNE